MSASAIRDRLLDNLRIRLPGALDGAMKLELFNALDELCTNSSAWREDITLAVTASTLEYDLVASDGVIHRLMWVYNEDDLPIKADMSEPSVLELAYLPNQAGTYTVTVALTVTDPVRVTDDFPILPDWMWDKHYACILDGVLSRMMSQPGKPYSSERLAIYHGRRFRNAIASARVEAMRSNKYRGQNWQFPQFAGRSS